MQLKGTEEDEWEYRWFWLSATLEFKGALEGACSLCAEPDGFCHAMQWAARQEGVGFVGARKPSVGLGFGINGAVPEQLSQKGISSRHDKLNAATHDTGPALEVSRHGSIADPASAEGIAPLGGASCCPAVWSFLWAP